MLPKRVVVGTDGSETASVAVRTAIELAQAFGAALHVVTAYQPIAVSALAAADPLAVGGLLADAECREATIREANHILEQSAHWAKEAGIVAEAHAVPKPAPEAILSTATAVGADLIVVGDKGMGGLRRFLSGSVPSSIARHAPCSVWIVDSCSQVRNAKTAS